jgi:hypothetical protein
MMQMKYLAAACGVALATLASSPALSNTVSDELAAVIPRSDVGLQFKPGTADDPGGTTGSVKIVGTNIAGSVGSTSFGSGASYASTSDIGPGVIYFKNGNASSGQFTFSRSVTLVDITFTNTSDAPVTPFLVSTIVPAGFGMFVGGNGCSANPESCNPADPSTGNFNSFRPVTDGSVPTIEGVPIDLLASAAFTFRIYADDFVAYELSGNLTLTYRGPGLSNVLGGDIARAQDELDGFRPDSPIGSPDFLGFVWDATDIDVGFPEQLLPGASSTLRYETIVESYSRASCLAGGTSSCLVSYASFGDPVSRRGGSTAARVIGGDAMLARSSLSQFQTFNDPPSGILFDEFAFRRPVFNSATGGISFELATGVPEPGNWAMLIAGFGLVGATLRQRRRLAA